MQVESDRLVLKILRKNEKKEKKKKNFFFEAGSTPDQGFFH